MKPKTQAAPVYPKNRFELLAIHSDSEEEDAPSAPSKPAAPAAPSAAPAAPPTPPAPPAPAALASPAAPPAPPAPAQDSSCNPVPFRTWTLSDSGVLLNRIGSISTKEDTKNLFQSPFSRGSSQRVSTKEKYSSYRTKGKLDGRPRFEKDDEGWVSIGCRKKEEAVESVEATSVLDSAQQKEQVEQEEQISQTDHGDHMNKPVQAHVWAERVRESLEKAEETRLKAAKNPTERLADIRNSLSRLSFFRRPMVVDGSATQSNE
jgi:hypothetical protein